MDPDLPQKRNIVIIGAGIIGCTTAYYLTRHPKYDRKLHTITLVDAAGIASGASGKAGGLLGLWAYPKEIVPLSYDLHKKLAAEHDGAKEWGYRQLDGCGKITVDLGDKAPPSHKRTAKDVSHGANGRSQSPKKPKRLKRHTLPEPTEPSHLEMMLPNLEPQPEPAPYVVASEPGRTNGAATRWKPHYLFSDGVITVGERSSTPVEQGATDGQSNGTAGSSTAPDQSGSNGDGSCSTLSNGTTNLINGDSAAGLNGTNGVATVNGDVAIKTAPDEDEPEKNGKWKKLPKQNVAAGAILTQSPLPADLNWVTENVSGYEQMGAKGQRETAQVQPYQFTNMMEKLARESGVRKRLGFKVTEINKTEDGVRSVEVLNRANNTREVLVDVTDVVIAAGPWTPTLLANTAIVPIRVHSVVWNAEVSPFAVFTHITLPPDYVPAHRQKPREDPHVDPEVYARPNGEVYACGETDRSVPLPETADKVETDDNQCEDLVTYIGSVSPVLANAPVKSKQACYVPQRERRLPRAKRTEDLDPIFGETSTRGLWVASGHTCWGIQNGPATALLLAEMMLDGVASSLPPEKIAKFLPKENGM